MERKLIEARISELIPYGNNPRKNEKAVDAVSESIRQTGYNNPIVVDENMVVLAGHTRLKSLVKLGIMSVDVLQVTGLSEEEKKKYRLLDNKVGEFASWDYVALMEELVGLDWEGLELDWGLDGMQEETEEPGEDNTSASKEKEETEYECPECGYRFKA